MLLPLVLLSLAGCTSVPNVVEKTRDVMVQVPVIVPLDARLTRDCVAQYQYKDPTKLPIGELIYRLNDVEDALAICNSDKALIREAQHKKPSQ